MTGDRPECSTLEDTAHERAIEEAVYFTGFVSDIAEHLQAIDILLLTSFSEGTSMTLLEAVYGYRSWWRCRSDRRDELYGILVPSGDVDALVDRLTYLHNNSEYM